MYTTQHVCRRLPSAASISLWKCCEAFLKPMGNAFQRSRPCVLVMKAVQSLHSSARGSCQKADPRSSVVNHVDWANWSTSSSSLFVHSR